MSEIPSMKGKHSPPCKIYHEHVRNKIYTAVAKSCTFKHAAEYAGIRFQTLNEWMKKGRALSYLPEEQLEGHPEKIYVEFFERVKYLESYSALVLLDKIENAANVHWQAAAWKLERRHPKEYGRPEKKDPQQQKQDNSIEQAKDTVNKLKSDQNGRSPTTTS